MSAKAQCQNYPHWKTQTQAGNYLYEVRIHPVGEGFLLDSLIFACMGKEGGGTREREDREREGGQGDGREEGDREKEER